jgi:hypothetical protein
VTWIPPTLCMPFLDGLLVLVHVVVGLARGVVSVDRQDFNAHLEHALLPPSWVDSDAGCILRTQLVLAAQDLLTRGRGAVAAAGEEHVSDENGLASQQKGVKGVRGRGQGALHRMSHTKARATLPFVH